MILTDLNETQKITPEKAITLLQKKGISMTPEEAALILELLYILAGIYCKQQSIQ